MKCINRSHAALVASFTVVAGLLVVTWGGMSHAHIKFSGAMHVRQGQKECLAVRESVSLRSSVPQESNVAAPSPLTTESGFPALPGNAIPFQDPQITHNWIDPNADYEVLQLLFFVRLDRLAILSQPPPRDSLEVSGPEGEKNYPVAPGETVTLPGASLRVKEVRKWSGLLRDPNGRPMVSISLRQGDDPWSEQLFLAPGSWVRVGTNMDITWQWVESEQAAQQAVSAGIPQAGAPRWCVLDGTALNWFESFDPGTGVELSDGTTVTLLKFEEERTEGQGVGPAILVEIERNGQRRQQWVAANEYDDKSLVRFDYPLKRATVFVLFGWQDGQALVAIYHHGKPSATRLLMQGDIWQPEEKGWALRIDDVAASAISVKSEDSPFYEAVVELAGKDLRLRQAEAVRQGDLLFRFVREAAPPTLQYDLSLVNDKGESVDSFTLMSGQTADRQGWRFSQGVSDPRTPEVGVLMVSPAPNRRLIFIGSLVALVGFAGFGLSRLLPKRA